MPFKLYFQMWDIFVIQQIREESSVQPWSPPFLNELISDSLRDEFAHNQNVTSKAIQLVW